MNDFEYDVKQKKDIARSAAHKVNGAKSRKCTLRTDNMTDAQIKKMNGQEISYNINEPMQVELFKQLPVDSAKEYILRLNGLYGVGYKHLACMFGCSRMTCNNMLGSPPYNIKFKKGNHMSDYQREQWERFLNVGQKRYHRKRTGNS